MRNNGIMSRTYRALENRRALLVAGTIALALLCLAALLRTTVVADIRSMLPGGETGSIASDFDLLNRSTLSSRIMITVRGNKDVSRDALADAADILALRLPDTLFRLQSTADVHPPKVLGFLLDNAPNLTPPADLERIQESLTAEGVRRYLTADYKLLTSPQGLILKDLVRRDPLDMRSQLARRLAMYRTFSDVTLHRGHVFSQDGHAVLLMADTPVPMTDSDGARELIAAFDAAVRDLPHGTEAAMVSGHLHTDANASTIKRDLTVISVASFLALALLFTCCFRSFRALGVLAAPLLSLCAALGMTALAYETLSAIVIGFGAVLLGISIDFAMHAYYAVGSRPDHPGRALASLATPLLFGLATSCAAFGALFFSGIPGIRQLAFFSIAGLCMAALYALFVLPPLCGAAPVRAQNDSTAKCSRHPRVALDTVAVLLIAGIWTAMGTTLDTDLRSMGVQSESIRKAEQTFNQTWGDSRNKAVIFADGPDMDAALARNEQVWKTVQNEFPGIKGASLAPLLPARETQAENRARWEAFWTRNQETTQALLLEQGKPLHFSAQAFAPFLQNLTERPAPVTPDTLRQAGLGMLLRAMAPEPDKDRHELLTFLPDTEAVRTFFSPEREQELGVRLISRQRFKHTLEATMRQDIVRFIAASGISVVALAFLLFRNPRRSLLSLLPPGLGVVAVFAVLAAAKTPMNLFHIVALPLVIGLGADYGIFMVCRERAAMPLSTVPAIRLSGLTTLAAFGVLALARHPSLHSLGMTVLLGVGAALLTALYLLPHLLRRPACA
ncbi:MMPL family transporter [Salidesulfovibrio onnuriiensis]|uniref:MMPL family transporter n=1 Tax=Salidesulfovibrio onnuriiensis TaxID=2583823 RepID=UPI0011CC02AC|nr:MMPL family transporter [Salidesulfovibrio onnuriiensis]